MEVLRKEGIFRLFDRHATLILTDEAQLSRIIDAPDEPLFDDEQRGFSGEKKGLYEPGLTLRKFCEDAAARGCDRIEVSYDFFFGGSTRTNYPDSELTVKAFKVIHDFALRAGMTFGASLISPLDLGGGYAQKHDNTGFSWQFQEGAIEGGAYRVPMRLQRQWYNNKGPIALTLVKLLAVAFDEQRIGESAYYYVDENSILDISESAECDIDESSFKVTGAGYGYGDMVFHGRTDAPRGRVLCVAVYRTPELDYFDEGALPYIKSVIDLHNQNGTRYQGYYSDEMHIQFDWDLGTHFGPTEINTRYVTPALTAEYARRFGAQYADFLKYMVYFAYHQHDFLPGEEGKLPSQHVMGKAPGDVYRTWLFRKNYFEMLSEKVLSLSMDALHYSEQLFGGPIMTRAHATWQESPTCDHFYENDAFSGQREAISRYDYTPHYIWSSSIRENVSACYDYFRWNEFLTGSGNDHPEGGNSDRNYYAQALACSFGVLNRFPYAYCGSWGSPAEVLRRLNDVGIAYGTPAFGPKQGHNLVQGVEHRLTDVLLLYPLELNYVEERFGSWMVQYGYGNYITEEKLLQYAQVTDDGKLRIRGREYRALVALFEPFLDVRTLALLEDFTQKGGRLVWTSIPAVAGEDGGDIRGRFLSLFGLRDVAPGCAPLTLKGQSVTFEGALEGIAPMPVLTDMLPDFAYPAVADGAKGSGAGGGSDGSGGSSSSEVIARCGEHVLGTLHRVGKGCAAYLGFRVRDDQSASLGADVDTLFAVLRALGAYDAQGLEIASRPTDSRYVMNAFANGAVSVANHYRLFEERWYGSFFRDEEKDAELLRGRELPPVEIALDGVTLLGHTISHTGCDALSYRYCAACGKLMGFAGADTTGITIDGKAFVMADRPATFAWAMMPAHMLAANIKQLVLLQAQSACELTISPPFDSVSDLQAGCCELDYYKTDAPVAFEVVGDAVRIRMPEACVGKWIALYR